MYRLTVTEGHYCHFMLGGDFPSMLAAYARYAEKYTGRGLTVALVRPDGSRFA